MLQRPTRLVHSPSLVSSATDVVLHGVWKLAFAAWQTVVFGQKLQSRP